MPTVLSSTKALKNVPDIRSLLISAGPGFDECSLCGNSFETGGPSNSTRIKLPCIDTQCEPCARMWRILSSPICKGCYADFTCPNLARDQAQIHSPQLNDDGNDMVQRQSLSNPHVKSPLTMQDRNVAYYSADADADDDTMPNSGIPMRETDDDITAVGEFADEDLREALFLANNRAGTNFNIQEIEDEIPLAVLRTGTRTQLADTLTQLCIQKASESDKEDTGDESSQQGAPSEAVSQHDEEAAQENSLRCTYCKKTLRSIGHLQRHMVIHETARRTCSICGRVLGNSSSRQVHEDRHRETESQRNERLRKAKMARDQVRAGQKVPQLYRPKRVPQVLE